MGVFFFENADCVFIHIPKTGGASIRHGLFKSNYLGPRYGAMPPEWRGKFAFCFVRNPFDRLISAWKMFTTGMERTRWTYPEDGDRTLSLSSFLDIVTDESAGNALARKTFNEKIRHHTIPQTHPLNNLADADFVGRFENFSDDLARIFVRIGMDMGPLPHLNRAVRKGYRTYFKDETRTRAEEFYAEDLAELGYAY